LFVYFKMSFALKRKRHSAVACDLQFEFLEYTVVASSNEDLKDVQTLIKSGADIVGKQ